MAHERSNDQTTHVPTRAVAHHHNASGISMPAVQAVQRAELKSAEEEAVIQEHEERSALPKAFALPVGNKNNGPVLTGLKPFQLKPFSTVIQRKRIFVETWNKRSEEPIITEVDHKDLVAAVQRKVLKKGNGILIDIGTDEEWLVPLDDLIQSVKNAIPDIDEGVDEDEDMGEDVNGEIKTLLEALVTMKDGDKKKRPTKRKRRKSTPTPRKKTKLSKPKKKNSQDKDDEKGKDTSGGQPLVEDTVHVEEEAPKPEEPEGVLKFLAWNANHFGKGNDLDEKQIIKAIKGFRPQGNVTKMKQFEDFGYTSSQIEGFLQVLNTYSGALPVYSKTTEVDQLMEAVKALSYILERLGDKNNKNVEKPEYYKGKYKAMVKIAGSLKKHYMLEHSKHLLKVHPNLVIGFNEVGEGVGTIKKRLEGATGDKDRKKGAQLQQGPKLQSISINVSKLNNVIRKHNNKGMDWMEPFTVKKKYGDADLHDHYEVFTDLGKPENFLRKSQIEYYPIVFDSGRYEYIGSMIVSGSTKEDNNAEKIWTKNPYFTEYIKFRPIVVHRLAIKKDEKDKEETEEKVETNDKKEKEIWYGMVHTSPDGDEFDRREIYEEQLSVSLPTLKNLARDANAQLIVGGDYYIAEEALIATPYVPKGNSSTSDVETDDPVEYKGQKLGLGNGRSVGWSERDKGHFIGTQNEIRNLSYPESHSPYNFKDTLKEEGLKDVRSLTGTNENALGLQSADYFIVDTQTSKTYQAGIIDPVTGLPFLLESDNREMSDAWFSFSDHVPVMLVISAEKNEKAVGSAFPNNKGYFNNDPHNSNLFDLRFLQVSNAMTYITKKGSDYPEDKVKPLIEAFDIIKGKRRSGSNTEEDLIEMNKLKTETDKLLEQKSEHLDISTAMFETYQASEAYITTILFQIWSDIASIDLDHGKTGLLNHIQDVRMIYKEEKINAAYRTKVSRDSEEPQEAMQTLKKYLKEESLNEIAGVHAKIKDREDDMDMSEFSRLKHQLHQELFNDLMAAILKYITATQEDAPTLKGKHENIVLNYKLLGEIAGNKTTTHSMRKRHESGVHDEETGLWGSHDPIDVIPDKGGIPNRGNDCFLNSLCQLLSLPVYQNLMLDGQVRGFVSKVDRKEKISRPEVRELRLYLYMLNQVKTMGGQEDAAELLGKLMDEIDERQITDLQQYESMFKVLGSYKRTIIDSKDLHEFKTDIIDDSIEQWPGGVKTTDQQPENILNIPVDGAGGLIEWLNQSREYTFAPQNVKSIEWAAMNDRWHSVLKMREETIFKHLPSVLTIALKRFSNTLQKIDRPFNMPVEFWLIEQNGTSPVKKHYALQGFIYHQGTFKGGHYWAHKKNEDGNWTKAEDSRVSPSDMQSINTEGAFQHDINKAYIYTYMLTHTTPVTEENK